MITSSSSASSRLRGIVPPMVTPLSAPDTLDVPGLERLVEHIISGGVHGLFLLGTTGEAPSLSYRLRQELIVRSCRLVRERVPVLVGITDTSFTESLNVARCAAEAGATALVLSAPYYHPTAQPELGEYIAHLAPRLPLPVFLYNMPAMTKTVFGLETLRQALDLPNVIGLKDSGGDLAYYKDALAIARQRPDWSVLIGPEALLQQSLALGGDGGVSGGANLCPRLFVDLFNAFEAGDTALGAKLQAQVEALDQLYRIGRHASSIVKGLKCALSLRGICDDAMAEPFARFAAPERARVENLLATTLAALPLPPA
ncbi:dihydrodipicolinate synthase family protein [Geminisphaera colitermitum]|uniref:dihydrodipicolinate synthase family protein n=1 Tax=Geminisphaera colitermitum TaxID=1148786 RepID=UPI000158CC49|nr:dihydrodipicolinate synthase family protein [Geminisphaera colitermitum]